MLWSVAVSLILNMNMSRERYELSWTEEDPSVRNGEDDHKVFS